MEGELGSGIRIAIALVVVCAIIATIFAVIGVTRSTTNNGMTTVQNSMDQMSLTEFENYDQQIVSGTQVKSAVALYSGRAIAIVTRTTAAGGVGFNYGAILEGATTDTTTGYTTIPAATFTKAEGCSWYEINYRDTPISYNMDTKPINSTGYDPYIRTTAKYMAELIKDKTGTIVGICFSQM